MSWSLREKKEDIVCNAYFVRRTFFLRFVFYLNVECIEYVFRIYILLHIKKYYFIHFYCLLLKSSKAFTVSLKQFFLESDHYVTISVTHILCDTFLKILSDNTTAVHCMSNMGSCRSVDCSKIVKLIWDLPIKRRLFLPSVHIPDRLSTAPPPKGGLGGL